MDPKEPALDPGRPLIDPHLHHWDIEFVPGEAEKERLFRGTAAETYQIQLPG